MSTTATATSGASAQSERRLVAERPFGRVVGRRVVTEREARVGVTGGQQARGMQRGVAVHGVRTVADNGRERELSAANETRPKPTRSGNGTSVSAATGRNEARRRA